MENKQVKTPKLHELVGRIQGKVKEKVYGKSKFANTHFYRLNVQIENKEGINTIFAFKDAIEKESVWKDLEESNYIDKKYLFYCAKSFRGYRLINWKELRNSYSANKDHAE